MGTHIRRYIIEVCAVTAIGTILFLLFARFAPPRGSAFPGVAQDQANQSGERSQPTSLPRTSPTETPAEAPVVAPVAEFRTRITKKRFGTYVTPARSPVQPERFRGFHTGVDIEYSDSAEIVPVLAATSGRVLLARWVSGYGGLVVIQHEIAGRQFVAFYGHLEPAQLPDVGQAVQTGQSIGVLGDGYSRATDGERKHLHFAIIPGTTVDLRGYVTTSTELTQRWAEPLEYVP